MERERTGGHELTVLCHIATTNRHMFTLDHPPLLMWGRHSMMIVLLTTTVNDIVLESWIDRFLSLKMFEKDSNLR